ncbi:PD-(D/E)XK nuclease family protein [Paucibacter sp. APW11]|uniref:PD-(D/E)XK nuclease family protein n=1 Tax=Roseateles aquae TaxID=3077235 RepID=A0ABU3P6Y1_9BURK|nr:PD-(D/E)XK nuclease family protein [Paucibacter sp. APW11]MDT8997980.1 PD-(D/E)XK nuclease family protein [Paucibacter sp. APW11]
MDTLTLPLDAAHAGPQFWPALARRAHAWLQARGLASRDAVLLLPFAQHLAPARRAWMGLNSWQPRIETTHSLASALRPSTLPAGLQLSMDAAIDTLSAQRLLAQQSWAQALRRSDERAYQLALGRLVEAAHAFARHAQHLAPGEREPFWQRARLLLQGQGSGVTERALALVALEWAAADTRSPATDALFELRPSAWIYLQAGGEDALSLALLSHAETAGVPVLRLMADHLLDEVYGGPDAVSRPAVDVQEAQCSDFESLAQCAAAAVLDELAAGRTPVALIAQDRVLIRRVRALLDRQQIAMADETGWTLATTPEAAQVLALLRAAASSSSLDDWLAFLKTDLAATLRERAGSAALAALESQCRARGWSRPAAVRPALLAPGAARLWQLAALALTPLQPSGRALLADWLQRLNEVLQALGAVPLLEQREAGGPLLDALWLRRSPWPETAHEWALQQSQLGAREFVDWVDASLEAHQFVPKAAEHVDVVITPLARAMLRPFAAVVLPGADAGGLGPVPAGPALLPDSLALQLGLSSAQSRREALASSFVQLLRSPRLLLLRRSLQGSEPLSPSPLLERLQLARERAGLPRVPAWTDPRRVRAQALRPQSRAAVRATGALPERLSASAVDSLRNCPYQFFARSLLGLRDEAELQAEIDKRDYGSWLHAVLYAFHEQRSGDAAASDEAATLHALAQQQCAEMALAEDEFLPYLASFERFVPRYLDWLAAHEREGWRYRQGELERECQPWPQRPELAGIKLIGRLDRVDQGAQGEGQVLLMLDYKTGSAAALKSKVEQPLEDTQLAVYAALMDETARQEGAALRARYLALDDSKGLVALEHEHVQHSAALLIEGLGEDLLAIHGGTALPALGEGLACGFCEMRGLCRRDDWRESAV